MPAALAPSRPPVHDAPERRARRRSRGIKEFSCETCGKVSIFPRPPSPPPQNLLPDSLPYRLCILLTLITQVYRHPNCLVKHRWEHNPFWTEASQFLLSKHQQVQLMEAAAILTHGRSLPNDRALWPSYMSNGALPSPAIAGDGTPREKNNFDSSLTTSSFPDHPPSISDDGEDDMAADSESVEEDDDDEEEDDKTDESDVPAPVPSYSPSARRRPSVVAPRATAPVDIRRASVGPARNHESRSSIGYSPYGPPRSICSPRWGVIGAGEAPHHTPHLATSLPTGHRGYLDQQYAAHPAMPPTAGKPMAIPTPRSPYSGPQSFSSFSSVTQSFGSSSTSSHIPSSSIRSVEAEEEDDDDDNDYEDAYVSHYRHAPPSAGSKGLKWSPPQPAPRTVYEDIDEFEMDMD